MSKRALIVKKTTLKIPNALAIDTINKVHTLFIDEGNSFSLFIQFKAAGHKIPEDLGSSPFTSSKKIILEGNENDDTIEYEVKNPVFFFDKKEGEAEPKGAYKLKIEFSKKVIPVN